MWILQGDWIFFLLLFGLLLSACGEVDELSGKTFDVSVRSNLMDPDDFQPVMTLEFSDEGIVKNTRGYEEGKYAFNEGNLVIQLENENEKAEVAFTLEESTLDFSTYAASIGDIDYESKVDGEISVYRDSLNELNQYRHFEFVEK